MNDVRVLAREHGINSVRKSKADLIREIQLAEGNFDCFGTATAGICDQINCLWREDCLA